MNRVNNINVLELDYKWDSRMSKNNIRAKVKK